MRIRLFLIFLIIGLFLNFPSLLFGQTSKGKEKPNYYIQTSGGIVSSWIQDAASTRNFFIFRKLIDLSPTRWGASGPMASLSFHIERSKLHHHFILGYNSMKRGTYKGPSTNLEHREDTRKFLRIRYRMGRYIWRDILVPKLDLAVGPQVFLSVGKYPSSSGGKRSC